MRDRRISSRGLEVAGPTFKSLGCTRRGRQGTHGRGGGALAVALLGRLATSGGRLATSRGRLASTGGRTLTSSGLCRALRERLADARLPQHKSPTDTRLLLAYLCALARAAINRSGLRNLCAVGRCRAHTAAAAVMPLAGVYGRGRSFGQITASVAAAAVLSLAPTLSRSQRLD